MMCSTATCNGAHRGYLGEGTLLLLTPEGIVQSHGDHTRVQGTHSLHSQPGEEGGRGGERREGRKEGWRKREGDEEMKRRRSNIDTLLSSL